MKIRKLSVTLSAAAASLALFASPAMASEAVLDVPKVDLSPASAHAIHNPDGTWDIPFSQEKGANALRDGFCRGSWILPSIVAGGGGTYTHYGVKYTCTEPVAYSLEIRSSDYYEETPTGPVLGHLGGDPAYKSGVSPAPYLDTNSYRCKNNLNSGWTVTEFSTVRGLYHNGTSNRVTVGCRV